MLKAISFSSMSQKQASRQGKRLNELGGKNGSERSCDIDITWLDTRDKIPYRHIRPAASDMFPVKKKKMV